MNPLNDIPLILYCDFQPKSGSFDLVYIHAPTLRKFI